MVLYVPVVGECSEVDSAAKAAACAKYILMTECKPECAVSAHAESCDCSCMRAADSLVSVVYILNKFLADVCLELALGVCVAVEIPRLVSIGANKDNAILVCQLGKLGLCMHNPVLVVTAVSVEEIYNRHCIRVIVLRGSDNDVEYVAVHGLAMDFYSINALGIEAE